MNNKRGSGGLLCAVLLAAVALLIRPSNATDLPQFLLSTELTAAVQLLLLMTAGLLLWRWVRRPLLQRLQENEQRFQYFATQLPGVVYRLQRRGDEGRIAYCNDRAAELLGLPPGHFSGAPQQRWLDAMHPGDRQPFLDNWQRVLAQGDEHFYCEYRMCTRDGADVWLADRAQLVYHHDGTLTVHGVAVDISQQKSQQHRLADVTASLERAQRLARVGSWEWRVESDELYWSDEYLRITGLSRSSLNNDFAFYLRTVHTDDVERVEAAVQRALRDPDYHYELERRLLRGDGQQCIVRESAEVERNERGEPVRLTGVLEDISHSREAQQQLRATMATLERAQKIAHIGSWTFDPATQAANWSPEASRIFGYQPSEVCHRYEEFLQVVHPGDRERLNQAVAQAVQGSGSDYYCEHRLIHPDGRERMVIERGEIVRDAEGRAVEMVGTVQDVTEQKQAEERLQLAQQVINSASDAVVITDLGGLILDVNPAYTRITGYHRQEVIGLNPSVNKSGRHDQGFYQGMWQTLLDTGSWSGEIWDRRKNGEIYPKLLSINTVKTPQGEPKYYVGIFSDITLAKESEKQLEQLAYYDPLTGLPNRTLFRQQLEQQMTPASKGLSLFYLDLDNFKKVNDSLGHSSGDELLIQVAQRIRRCLRPGDTVARLGGDELTVILPGLFEQPELAQVARRMLNTIRAPISLAGQPLFVTASIGIAVWPNDGEDSDSLSKHADIAMYVAKSGGGDDLCFFSPEMQRASSRRLQLETAIRHGLKRGQFQFYYQPKVDLRSQQIVGMEALVRWYREDGTVVSPAEFIPVAEETGLIIPLGEQLLLLACDQVRRWNSQRAQPLKLALNLSARQFQQDDLGTMIQRILKLTGLAPALLELEITESMVMDDVEQAVATLQRLKAIGVSIPMDDFGTGYSSLSYLQRFPIDTLKIDRSFIRELEANGSGAGIVSAIITMARSLELGVVAEGVETESQADFLVAQGCPIAQGYLFGKPLPVAEFERRFVGCLSEQL